MRCYLIIFRYCFQLQRMRGIVVRVSNCRFDLRSYVMLVNVVFYSKN